MMARRCTSPGNRLWVRPTFTVLAEATDRGARPSRCASGIRRPMIFVRHFRPTAGRLSLLRTGSRAKGASTSISQSERGRGGVRREISARGSIRRLTTSSRRSGPMDVSISRRIVRQGLRRNRREIDKARPGGRFLRPRIHQPRNSIYTSPVPNPPAKTGRFPSLWRRSTSPIRMNALPFLRPRERRSTLPLIDAINRWPALVSDDGTRRILICIGPCGTACSMTKPRTSAPKSTPRRKKAGRVSRPKGLRSCSRAIVRGRMHFFRAGRWKSIMRPAGTLQTCGPWPASGGRRCSSLWAASCCF